MKIAIDPGKSGAIAFSFPDGNVISENCPSTIKDMIDILKEIKCIAENHGEKLNAVIEKVHAMPGNGVTSIWTFSENYAIWRTAMVALEIPFIEILPNRWMKLINGLPRDKKDRKNTLKSYSQQLYPHLRVTLKNADALAMLSIMNKL